MLEFVRQRFAESIEVKQAAAEMLAFEIAQAAVEIVCSVREGKKVIFCGNGGSAADSQHLAAEFVGRFQMERAAVPALALNTNSSAVTAIGNDYGFDDVFARQTAAFAQEGDIFVGLSTSGNSESIVRAAVVAREKGAFTIGMTGANGGRLAECVDIALRVPSECTARIQESHITIGHIICELVESEVFAHAVA